MTLASASSYRSGWLPCSVVHLIPTGGQCATLGPDIVNPIPIALCAGVALSNICSGTSFTMVSLYPLACFVPYLCYMPATSAFSMHLLLSRHCRWYMSGGVHHHVAVPSLYTVSARPGPPQPAPRPRGRDGGARPARGDAPAAFRGAGTTPCPGDIFVLCCDVGSELLLGRHGLVHRVGLPVTPAPSEGPAVVYTHTAHR